MATIMPFRGYRPLPDLAHKICSPPYDIISSEEARSMAESNPLSFIRVVKPEVDLDPETDIYSDPVYEKGVENLRSLIDSGNLVRDEKPSLYLYRLAVNGHSQTGIMCASSVDDYDNGIIKRHELTRNDREEDRTKFVNMQNGNAGPVFLAYREKKELSDLVNSLCADQEPDISFKGGKGITHSLWAVSDGDSVNTIVEMFAHIPSLYIADGHHRAFAASKARQIRAEKEHNPQAPWNYFLTVIFPDTQLSINNYNRVIKELNSLSAEDLLEKIGAVFDIDDSGQPPSGPKEFGLYIENAWYKLTAKQEIIPNHDPVKSLDVAILHDNIISPILGITDLKKDKRIEFVGGTQGREELERRVAADCVAAFELYPPTIQELMDVSDAGLIMPPKSTWFYPKPDSGMCVYLFD
jgi:uncharacterized protein (DUF1015 family)